MNKRFPLLSRVVLVLVLPLAIGCAAGVWWLRASLPQESGELVLAGPSAPVSITRDRQGVPHIVGTSDIDVFFATGYVHAQDRRWQLEFQRRFAQGRLSELFGRASLDQDVWLRTLGLYRSAQDAWDALDPAARRSLQAYTDGINAWLAGHTVLPPEFALLGVRPEPWTVVDSLAWVKVFSLNLSGNLNRETARFAASQVLSARELESLFGTQSGAAQLAHTPAAAQQLALLARSEAQFGAALGLGGRFVGSNAWVVSGAKAADGGAMLANDPHLGLQAPSLWYPVVQQGAALSSSGMSLVGLPLVIFGHNGHIAWGGTSLMADVQDLYVEQVNPVDAGSYRVGDHWQRFVTRQETIRIKAEFPAVLRPQPEAVQLTVRSTGHGPVVSDLLNAGGPVAALRWTGLDKDDTTYASFLRLNYAHDWVAFRQALAAHVGPTLNMLYADRAGNIGMQGVGRIPLRGPSVGGAALAGHGEWLGYIPAERMPSSYNPPAGFIVSANERNLPANYPYFVSDEWAQPARAERIASLLTAATAGGRRASVDDFARMQADVLSTPALKMVALLGTPAPASARQQQALAYLHAWDGGMGRDSRAATIFQAWMRHLRKRLVGERLHTAWGQRAQADFLDGVADAVTVEELLTMLGDEGVWCRHGAIPGARSCEAIAARALDDGLDELEKLAGHDMRAWEWGKLHTVVYRHTPFSQVNLLRQLFERRAPAAGAGDTINVSDQVFVRSEGYLQSFGASFRQIVAFGPEQPRHLYMNSTGQSGNLLSAHYGDMVAPFGAVQHWPLTARVSEPAATLVLRPAPTTTTGKP